MGLTGKPDTALDAIVSNDGFFPDLAGADFLNNYRIIKETPAETIIQAMVLAIIEVNEALAPIKTAWLVDYASLEDYAAAHSEQVNDVEIIVTKYQEAVFSLAKKWLMNPTNTQNNRRDKPDNLLSDAKENEDHWLNQSQKAIDWFYRKAAISKNGAIQPSHFSVGMI